MLDSSALLTVGLGSGSQWSEMVAELQPDIPHLILASALVTLGIVFVASHLVYQRHSTSKAERAHLEKQYKHLSSHYKTVVKPIAFSDEKPIEIKSLYIYPIKGIRTSPVD
jgi:hypothetical protein